jgi:hypothetical protein
MTARCDLAALLPRPVSARSAGKAAGFVVAVLAGVLIATAPLWLVLGRFL